MMHLSTITPILRMFDVEKTRAFYVGYLGFGVDWEHRFEPKLPLYMQVSRSECRLHLSEHHGDCCPGSKIRIACGDVGALLAELRGKSYDMLRPCIETPPWGGKELTLIDPASNGLVFVETAAKVR